MLPEGACACGRDLAEARDLGVKYSHQVADLPEAKAETTQYDRHEAECACGRGMSRTPRRRPGRPGTVTYGLNFQAWCVFLMVMHHVPVERCADILESMSGTRPSDGWVHALLDRAASAVAAANKAIRALIILARVIAGTRPPPGGARAEVRKKYLQVACTSLLTYHFLGDRDLPSFKGFIYSDLHGTVVVHDRYQTRCATRRTAISPAERAENGGDVFGSDALPEAERLNGNAAWQKTGSLCPGVRNGVPGDPRDMVKS